VSGSRFVAALLCFGLAAGGSGGLRAEIPPLEDLFELRARGPDQAPAPPRNLLTPHCLATRDAGIHGWVELGIGGNSLGSPFNGPVVLDDRAGQAMLQQLYLAGLKPLGDEAGWGGRVDLLYGTDWWTAVARGLDAFPFDRADALGVPRWQSSRYYGLAMPQAYLEFGHEGASILVGHFYTPLGYEVVPAVGNFFLTRNYTFEYGTPTTHTGVLGSWQPRDGLAITAGIMNGWDNFSDGIPPVVNPDYPGARNNLGFAGEMVLESEDGARQLGLALTTGNEYVPVDDAAGNVAGGSVGNLTMYTVYGVVEIGERLTAVVENSAAWQFNARGDDANSGQPPGLANSGQPPGLVQWYGITAYGYLTLTERLAAGMRAEWFRDNNGTRVVYPIRNSLTGGAPAATGFAGNFWALTWGLNWVPRAHWMVRPELRYDWYTPDGYGSPALPFGDISTGPDGQPTGNAYGQLYGGCDLVVRF